MAIDTGILKKRIQSDDFTEVLLDLYGDADRIAGERKRYLEAVEEFEKLYGVQEAEIYSAPGRSEVGGNHTDHQHGQVLACSLNLDIIAVVQKLDDHRIEFKSAGYPMVTLDVSDLEPQPEETGTTAALIRGVAAGMKRHGYSTGGFRAYVTSQVLSGSGMSSSAALEILLGTIFSDLYNDRKVDAVTLAKVGQYAENQFFGKPCGLMDQMACSIGGMVFIDFEDMAEPVIKPVNVDFAKYNYSLCIVDTRGSHANLTDDYAAIPGEMKQIAGHYGKEYLRQVDPADFKRDIPELRWEAGDRAVLRALHFFAENERAQLQKDALEREDFEEFLRLVNASGRSSFQYLQNAFAARTPEVQGIPLAIAVSEQVLGNRGAVRVHGGGFAGTIQAFVPDELIGSYRKTLDHIFGDGACHVLKVRKYGGICLLK